MKQTYKSAAIVATLGLAALGAVAMSQNTADAATVATTKANVTFTHLYTKDGNLITSRGLGPNTPWRVGEIKTINGVTMYQVATNEWLSSKDSTLNGQDNAQASSKLAGKIFGGEASMYNDATNSPSNRMLSNNSAWLIGKMYQNKNGEIWCQVSTHEYVLGSKMHFNMQPDQSAIQYNADFAITGNSDSTDTQTPSTKPDTNVDTGSQTPNTNTGEDSMGIMSNIASFRQQVLDRINHERALNGVEPLVMNDTLNAGAMIRAKEVFENPSHTRPNGSHFSTAMNDSQYNESTLGENFDLEHHQKDIQTLIQQQYIGFKYEAGSAHYNNWIYAPYKSVGIGVYYNNDKLDSGYYIVEDFATI